MDNKGKLACKIIGCLDLCAHCILFVATVALLVWMTLTLNSDPAPDRSFWSAVFNKADFRLKNGNSTILKSTQPTTDSIFEGYITLILFCFWELIYAGTASHLLTALITNLPQRQVKKRVEIWMGMKVVAVFDLLGAAIILIARGSGEWAIGALLFVAGNLLFITSMLLQFEQIFLYDVENFLDGGDLSSEEGYASKSDDESRV